MGSPNSKTWIATIVMVCAILTAAAQDRSEPGALNKDLTVRDGEVLSNVLPALQELNLKYKIENDDSDTGGLTQYVVFPAFQTSDALIILATAKGVQSRESPVVAKIYWALNWTAEAKQPKKYRSNRRLWLRQIRLGELVGKPYDRMLNSH